MLGHDHGDRAELALDGDWEALLDKLVEGEPGWQVPSLTMPNGTSFCTRLEGSNESVQSDAAESSNTKDNSVREHVEGLTTATALVSVDPTAKKFPNTYSRQKHEIGLLRQHAKALEDKLQKMAKPVETLKSTWGARRSPSASQSWKELADVQRRRLLLVQRENRTLRLSALEQKRMAKNLQQILMRRVVSKDVVCLLFVAGVDRSSNHFASPHLLLGSVVDRSCGMRSASRRRYCASRAATPRRVTKTSPCSRAFAERSSPSPGRPQARST